MGWRPAPPTSTVPVLARASEPTTPVRPLRRPRSLIPLPLHAIESLDLLFAHDGGDPSHLTANRPQSRGVVELVGGHLKPEVEQLLLGRRQLVLELVVAHVAQVHGLHSSSLFTHFVFTGNLSPARRIASRARSSVTPDNSNITRPGLTTATQNSGVPLAGPLRGVA